MEPMYYIGLDVHKRKISYCVKDSGGKVYSEGSLSATRLDLDVWMKRLPQPWSAAMEATMSTARCAILPTEGRIIIYPAAWKNDLGAASSSCCSMPC
jgi:hypothetical protein